MPESAYQARTRARPSADEPRTSAADPRSEMLNRAASERLAKPARLLAGVEPVQRAAEPNRTGLPDGLKSGVEALSGLSMDDVRVHRNSAKPAQLQAHAYAQGTDIHLAPGQDHHLPHEAWHVVQQKQGRVTATAQLKGDLGINDDVRLEREADEMGARALGEQRPPAASVSASVSAADTLQRKPVVQRAEIEAIRIAAEMAAGYGIHLNSMAEVMGEKYLFTAEEWREIVTAYNAGGEGLRLRYSYDPAQYIGYIEREIADQGRDVATLDRMRALAERYYVDAQARPGFYGRKVAKTAAAMMVGLAGTLIGGPVVGAVVGASAGVALNSGALQDQVKLAQQQYASEDYRNALVTIAQLGLSIGASAASATGHSHIAHVETGLNLVSGTAKKKLKTE